jgi:hypothetical protein
LMRSIAQLRKKAGLTIGQQITITSPAWPAAWQTEIERKTNSKLVKGDQLAIQS